MRALKAVTAAVLSLVSPFAWAADESRPNEDAMFGSGSPASSTVPAEKGAPPQAKPGEKFRDVFATGEVTENPLQIGGVYYQQLIVSGQKDVGVSNTPLTAPLQFDGYLDGRPNDRIRAYIDARLAYDPTRDQFSSSTSTNSLAVQTLQTQAQSSSSSPTGSGQTPNNPQVLLDQAWLKFDIDRTVFVTAGKQHLKWGTSRFWNPTDFLTVQKRNPLLPYDLRLGNYLVKFELPLEARKANLYAVALFDNPVPASTLGQVGGALRAEAAIGNGEFGLDFVARGGTDPVYGADLSTGLGPFDFYGEVALVAGSATAFQIPTLTTGANLQTAITTIERSGPSVQASGGLNYEFGWRENRLATVGFEYFYNQLGYDGSAVYPALIYSGAYQPFYIGRNYLSLYLTAEGLDAQKHTSYTFSTLGNFSDKSFISRMDFTWRVLTYLTFGAYFDVHYGAPGGEFNFALSTPALLSGSTPIPAISIPPTYFDLGLSLRVSI